MDVKAIVFDLDGTLFEFNLDYKTVRAEVAQFLIGEGVPASILSINESIFEMLKKAEIYMRNNGKKEKEFSALQKHALSISLEHEIKAARETSPLPGVLETLKTLKKRNLKLGVFTINNRKSTDYILGSFRMRRFFSAVVTREDVSRVKPDPLHLTAALNALSVDADETVVVGDSIVDMRSAKTSNATAVGVAASDDSVKKLKHAGAAYVINSITDLPRLIAELNGE